MPASRRGWCAYRRGAFWMGCNMALDPACMPDELPYREIMLSTFDIDITEVTQEAYQACVAAGGCTVPIASFDPVGWRDYPVVMITWTQAEAFCAWAGKRLPTEAEWEKAARGVDGRTYSWGETDPDCTLANFDACGNAAVPVTSQPAGAGPYGTLGMIGNVHEWVADWYDAAAYANAAATDPTGPATGIDRSLRGHAYNTSASQMRVADRSSDPVDATFNAVGVRCAR